MSCFIYVKTYDPPDDYWRHYALNTEKNHRNSDEVIECSMNDIENKKIHRKVGNGFFVKIDNKLCVVTCFHIIGSNNMEIYAIFFDKKTNRQIIINLTLIKTIEEFDIAILDINASTDLSENQNMYNDYELDTQINKINKKKKFIINSYIEKNSEIQYNNIETNFQSIENLKYITEYTKGYEIPFINVTISCGTVVNMQGISGSIVINDDIPIGVAVFSNIAKNIIHIIPISIVINIVKSFLKDESKELTLLILNADFVADKNDDVVNFYGHYVIENFGVNYTTDTKKKFNFKQDDIILKINNNMFLEDGTIWCEKLGCRVKFKTYAMLNFIFNNYVEICYMRNDKIYSCKIMGVNPQLYFSYNLQKQQTFLYHDGFTFVELSEYVLKYFESKNILIGDAKLNFINSKTKQKKYVVLASIDYNYLIETHSQNKDHWIYLKNSGFPFIDNKLTILKKIGNDEVTNLQTLKRILNKKSVTKTTTYSYY
jgi:hypothetical protein